MSKKYITAIIRPLMATNVYILLAHKSCGEGEACSFASMTCTVIVAAIYYMWETPREKILRKQNAALRERLDILGRRLDASAEVMDDIITRDDNFYRVMMGAPRLSASSLMLLPALMMNMPASGHCRMPS